MSWMYCVLSTVHTVGFFPIGEILARERRLVQILMTQEMFWENRTQ